MEFLKILFVALGTGLVANVIYFPMAYVLLKRIKKISLSRLQMFLAYLGSALVFGVLCDLAPEFRSS